MVRHKEYYKGEGGGFPQVRGHDEFCEFVFVRGSSVHQKCSKYALITCYLVCVGLCE